MDLAREEGETEMVNVQPRGFARFTVKGKSLLAARVRLSAVAQWHSRWGCPWMKHGETAGTGGNENMKGVGIAGIQT